MTAIVKHTIRSNQATAGTDTAAPAQPSNSQLRRQSRHRPAQTACPPDARAAAGIDGPLERAEAGPAPFTGDARYAATRVAELMGCKGGLVGDITVGDCVELADPQRRVHVRGGQRKVDFYLRLRALGI